MLCNDDSNSLIWLISWKKDFEEFVSLTMLFYVLFHVNYTEENKYYYKYKGHLLILKVYPLRKWNKLNLAILLRLWHEGCKKCCKHPWLNDGNATQLDSLHRMSSRFFYCFKDGNLSQLYFLCRSVYFFSGARDLRARRVFMGQACFYPGNN